MSADSPAESGQPVILCLHGGPGGTYSHCYWLHASRPGYRAVISAERIVHYRPLDYQEVIVVSRA